MFPSLSLVGGLRNMRQIAVGLFAGSLYPIEIKMASEILLQRREIRPIGHQTLGFNGGDWLGPLTVREFRHAHAPDLFFRCAGGRFLPAHPQSVAVFQ